MTLKNRLMVAVWLGALAALPLNTIAQAQSPGFAPTEAELALLPGFCHARISGNASAKKLWQERMGQKNFLHLHHYCFGLNFINRANQETDKRSRQYILKQASSQFDYVLNRWPADFPLTADAKVYKQLVESMRAY